MIQKLAAYGTDRSMIQFKIANGKKKKKEKSDSI